MALIGRGINQTADQCFTNIGIGGVTNGCTGPRTLIIPLHLDNGGFRSVIVSGKAPTADLPVACELVTEDELGHVLSFTGLQSLPTPGIPATMTLTTTAPVPSFGYLNLLCEVSTDGIVFGVNWGE
jgi:hypothetical protein